MSRYRDLGDTISDRGRQRQLIASLTARSRALQRDEYGAWWITGTRGHIYTWSDSGPGWQIYCSCHSARQWASRRRLLAFCKLTQDGESEGCFYLRDLPTPE